MEFLSAVSSSSSVLLSPSNPLHIHLPRFSLSTTAMRSRLVPRLAPSFFIATFAPEPSWRRLVEVCCRSSRKSAGGEGEERSEEEVERALGMDGSIPGTSDPTSS
ncbi:hypothetical protein SAY86_018241 [Trapa natans]|uniref:Uncharacterized protein n=1 Tax=Trapa natans TaxID=22666 RepID=A0AAN7R2Y3_TRANT|nr:hypothetical protein SAY86_018241 [Trapa natans]